MADSGVGRPDHAEIRAPQGFAADTDPPHGQDCEPTDHEKIRAEALKWRRRAAEDSDGYATDPKAETILELLDEVERLTKERDRLQHRIECADTPLMRDVMADRDAAEESVRQLREALEDGRDCVFTYHGEPADDPTEECAVCAWLNRVDEVLAAVKP